MSNKLFFSQNLVFGIITTKSTTLKFNNPFSFPLSLKCSITTSQSESITQPFAVSYLVNNFGFSTESAMKVFNSNKLRFDTSGKPDSVINLLKNHGFSQENIRLIIRKEPWLLSSQPHKILLPKLKFFLSDGAYSSDIIPLLTARPRILQASLEKRVIPLFELLSRFLTKKNTIVCLIRYWAAFASHPYHLIVSNINLTVDFGVSDSTIGRLLRIRPSIFGSIYLIKSLKEVKHLGFDPSTTTFGTALLAKQWMSNHLLWDKKVDVFIKWGWSDEDVIRAFRCQPSLMLTSIAKINQLMSFWVNQMGWNPLALTKSPHMFSFSLHKRVVPRASVLQYLLMKGLRKRNASLVKPFTYSEDMFLNKCVFSFKEESDYLLKLYDEKMKLANTMENNGDAIHQM